MTIIGYDISSHQSDNFDAPSDADFLFVKATEGRTYVHPGHDEQVARGRERGLVIGHYHWLWPTHIEDQARYFVQHANAKPGDVLVCDWEQQGTTNADKNRFIAEVRRLTNDQHRVMLYCNRSWYETSDRNVGDGLWLAEYGVNQPGNDDWLIWQHTQSYNHNGAGIDRNKAKFANRDSLRVWAGGKEEPGPPPPKIIHDDRVAFRGFTVCGCIATILPLIEADAIERGIIKHSFDIMQGSYNTSVSASAGTHSQGGAIDIAQHDDATGQVLVDWGCAAFLRTGEYHWNGGPHTHFFPQGCPHMSPALRVQARDWEQRMTALHPPYVRYEGPWKRLTWRAALNQNTGSGQAVNLEDDDMALDRFHTLRNKDQPASKKNTWYKLRVDDNGGQNIVSGPADVVSGTIYVTVDGLSPGQNVWLRPYTVDTSGKGKADRANVDRPIKIQGEPGLVQKPFPFTWNLGKDRALRWEWSASTAKANIRFVRVEGFYLPKD